MKILVDAGVNLKTRNKDGQTSLHIAVQSGDMEKVKFLVDAGATLEARNKDGQTSLHIAVQSGDMEKVKFLVDAGSHSRSAKQGWADITSYCRTKWQYGKGKISG